MLPLGVCEIRCDLMLKCIVSGTFIDFSSRGIALDNGHLTKLVGEFLGKLFRSDLSASFDLESIYY